jgi:hypothetical protein
VARSAKLFALGESFVILILLLALTLEYQNNLYLQLWVSRNLWPVDYLLNGTLVGLTASILVAGLRLHDTDEGLESRKYWLIYGRLFSKIALIRDPRHFLVFSTGVWFRSQGYTGVITLTLSRRFFDPVSRGRWSNKRTLGIWLD